MKKSLMAVAGGLALASAGSALAQSSVTLFGILDATVTHGSGSGSNRTQLANSGYNSSRLGFRGTEDLGGGLTASFWLEGSVANDTGTGAGTNTNNQASGAAPAAAGGQGFTFNRRSTLSLAGRWGELRLGRDYVPQYWNLALFDPFGNNGVGTGQTLNSIIAMPTAIRASNQIAYLVPGNLGGFYGQVAMYLGENSSNAGTPPGSIKNDGNGYGARIGYAAGPLDVALGLGRTKYAAGDFLQNNVAVKYDLGVAKIMAQYSFDKNDAVAGGADGRGYLIGSQIPVGPGEIRVAYSRYKSDVPGIEPTTKKFALGYVHNLSKRTAVYATFAHVSNSGGAGQVLNGATLANPNHSSKGYDIGIRHTF